MARVVLGFATAMRHRALRLTAILLLASVLLLPACESSSNPLEIDLTFEGELPFQSQVALFYTTMATGTIRVEVTHLGRPEFPDGDNVLIGLGFGIPNPSDPNQCAVTFQTSARQGSIDVIRLREGEQCIVLTEPGSIGETQIILYEIRVTDST